MSFLYPNILWGAIASLIPLIIHLISSRSTKAIEFSSIKNIQTLKSNSLKKLKIIQWLLVAARMLIILLLVVVFSGPIINSTSKWIPSERESIAVVIVDNSASMSVTRNKLSFLDIAKFQLPKILSSFDGLVDLRVYQTSPPREVYSRLIEKGVDIRIDDWKISQSYGTDKIWTFTDSLLNFFSKDLPNKECFIISDFPIAPPSSFDADFKEWQFYFFNQKPLENNLAINDVDVISQIKLPNKLLKLSAKIENMSDIEMKNIPVELYLSGDRSGQIVSSFQPNRSKDFLFQAYPKRSGLIRGRVEIEKDDFSIDNVQTFELSIPERISCKVIAPSQDKFFIINTALQSISGKDNFLDIELKIMPNIDRIYLEDTDVLILQDPKDISPSAIESIKKFLSRQGSVIWISGENYNLVNPLIVKSLRLPKFKELIKLEDNSFFSIKNEDRSNPIFDELKFRNPEISFPLVYAYNNVYRESAHESILTLSNDSPFLLKIPFLKNQIYFFTSPLDLKWNDFALKGLLIPTLHRILLLSINELNTSPVLVGQPKIIKLDSDLIGKKWIIKTPSGEDVLIIPNYEIESILYKQTDQLGSYEVYANDRLYTAFSTRLSPFESPNIRASKNNINKILKINKPSWIENNSDFNTLIQSQRYGRSLWRTFLICIVLLFILESFLSRPKTNSLKS